MIDWKARIKNKVTLLAFISAAIAFVYQILGIFGIVAPVNEDMIMQLIMLIINGLVAVGVVIDPTTPGISDK